MIDKDELIDIQEKRINLLLCDLEHIKEKFEQSYWFDLISEEVPDAVDYIDKYITLSLNDAYEEQHLLKIIK